jgi:hypothetical protein
MKAPHENRHLYLKRAKASKALLGGIGHRPDLVTSSMNL